MSAGAVVFRTGKTKTKDLGGLYRAMPLTMGFAIIGALSIAAFPLTAGFTTKSIILIGAKYEHLFLPWIVLEIAAAGVVFHAGLKYIYFVFFAEDKKINVKEAPRSMLLAMAFVSAICIYIGVHPEPLYDLLPHADVVKAKIPHTFFEIYGHYFSRVATQIQLILFSVLAFFIFLPHLKRTTTITIEFDWIYRKGSTFIYYLLDASLNGLNAAVNSTIAVGLTGKVIHFFKHGPANILVILLEPAWSLSGKTADEIQKERDKVTETLTSSRVPVGVGAFLTILILGFLIIL